MATIDGSTLDRDLSLEADVAIVGAGAGGGVAADVLSGRGLSVIVIEEGPYRTSDDFHMRETEAYPELYRACGGQWDAAAAIRILQGRCVGGSATVNWTTAMRAPDPTLQYWAAAFGVEGLGSDALDPWYKAINAHMPMADWGIPPNANNAILEAGARKLGWHFAPVKRNVDGCVNLGYCGLGCPVGAKRGALEVAIARAIAAGARLVCNVRVDRVRVASRDSSRLNALECSALAADDRLPTGRRVSVRARHYVLAAGAIHSPALLLRSGAPDPHRRLGKRTCLQPACASVAVMPDTVAAWSGAPQSIDSDHFLWRDGVTGAVGYRIEVIPLQPALAATALAGFGQSHSALMAQYPRLHMQAASLRDGFVPESPGGTVHLDGERAVLEYGLSDYLRSGIRDAYLSMAECQFAAGAERVTPIHTGATFHNSWSVTQAAITALNAGARGALLFSTSASGGCAMGRDPRRSVVSSDGRHHYLENLSVMDASVFPTSLGAPPAWTIYALAARQATALAKELGALR